MRRMALLKHQEHTTTPDLQIRIQNPKPSPGRASEGPAGGMDISSCGGSLPLSCRLCWFRDCLSNQRLVYTAPQLQKIASVFCEEDHAHGISACIFQQTTYRLAGEPCTAPRATAPWCLQGRPAKPRWQEILVRDLGAMSSLPVPHACDYCPEAST